MKNFLFGTLAINCVIGFIIFRDEHINLLNQQEVVSQLPAEYVFIILLIATTIIYSQSIFRKLESVKELDKKHKLQVILTIKLFLFWGLWWLAMCLAAFDIKGQERVILLVCALIPAFFLSATLSANQDNLIGKDS
jgi:hypothetical protein